MNNSEQLKAIPTEYKNTRFRSKLEAIFARNLELNGYYYWYEPSTFKLPNNYVPDFWVVCPCDLDRSFISLLIEYKPKEPTGTYLDGLAKNFAALPFPNGFLAAKVLVCGNSFDGPSSYSAKFWNGKDFVTNDSANWAEILLRNIQLASEYRFDLAD